MTEFRDCPHKRVLKCDDKEAITRRARESRVITFELGSETAALFHTPRKVRLEVRVINGIPLTLPNPLALCWLP